MWSFFVCRSFRGCPLSRGAGTAVACAGYREKFPVWVEGSQPHLVKDETPCPSMEGYTVLTSIGDFLSLK